MKCPMCNEPALRTSSNRYRPFCSKRCKLIDLSKWFGGEYAIAGPPVEMPDFDAAVAYEGEGGSSDVG